MIARVGASLALIALVSIGCGKYGPPVRVQPDAASEELTESAEEDSDREELRP